jgi:phospholipase C
VVNRKHLLPATGTAFQENRGLMTEGLANLRHIVVLMMQGRSFDHMLGDLKAGDPRINGLTGHESNLDTNNEAARAQPRARFVDQLDPVPSHLFSAVDKQLYWGTPGPPSAPSMGGFVQSYFDQKPDVDQSRKIMYYFQTGKLPVLQSLAFGYATFNGWFSSIPGPAPCNHQFAHYGTSFGQVGMRTAIPPAGKAYLSVYDRLWQAGRSARVYRYDSSNSILGMEMQELETPILATYGQFLTDCAHGSLPDYSFVAPNYNHHQDEYGGEHIASDQHPRHDVQAGEVFIATVYNAIRFNPDVWKSTALLIVYGDHGGIFDHVPPPGCVPDEFMATALDTGTGMPFAFDRLGIRVPAILVSPWILKGTVVPGPEDHSGGRTFEHASIPKTVTEHFIGAYENSSRREKAAQTFLGVLSDTMRPDADCPTFSIDPAREASKSPSANGRILIDPQRELASRATKNIQAFLCHVTSDKERVRKLYRDLKRDGVDPWLDEEDLIPGQDWNLEIMRAMAKSDICIICLSKSSLTKTGYVQKEIKYALDLADKRPEGAIFLIPARLEECEMPLRLAHLHRVDLFLDIGHSKLLRAIKSKVQKQ